MCLLLVWKPVELREVHNKLLGKGQSLLFRSRCSRLMIFLFGQRKFSHFLLNNAGAESGEEGNTFLLLIRCARHAVKQLQRLIAAHGLGLLLLCCWWGRRWRKPGHCFVWRYEWISFGVYLLIPPLLRWQLQKYRNSKNYICNFVCMCPDFSAFLVLFSKKKKLWAADWIIKLWAADWIIKCISSPSTHLQRSTRNNWSFANASNERWCVKGS